jgi:hypothetical protein
LLRGVRVGHSMSWQGRTPTSYKSIWPFGNWRKNGIISGEKTIESFHN